MKGQTRVWSEWAGDGGVEGRRECGLEGAAESVE